jgi:hypothetical protein
MTFGVVLFSLVFQGLTFELLVPKLKLNLQKEETLVYEKKLGESIALKAAIKELDRMDKAREISKKALDELKADYQSRKKELLGEISDLVGSQEEIRKKEDYLARRSSLLAMKSALKEALRKGIIGDEAAEELVEDIDSKLDELLRNHPP